MNARTPGDRTVIIHAGPAKTGTSAIQAWCLRNRAALRRHGIDYPRHPADGNDISSGHGLLVMDRNRAGEWRLNEAKLQRLLRRFYRGDAKTLLLSSEFLFNRLDRVCTLLPRARFLLYIRDPLDTVTSQYNQGVKRNRFMHPLAVRPDARMPVAEKLQRLIDEHPGIQLDLRPYSRDSFPGGNIVRDFGAAIGLSEADADDRVINPSYAFEALEFKRCANHFDLPRGLDSRLDRLLQRYRGGTRDYTLVPAGQWQLWYQRRLADLESVLARHPQEELARFVRGLARSGKSDAVRQEQGAMDFAGVVDYLRACDERLYRRLLAQVGANRHIPVPYPEFYRALGTDYAPESFTRVSAHDHTQLLKQLGARSGGVVRVALMQSRHFARQGRLELAREFLYSALSLRPGNARLRREWVRVEGLAWEGAQRPGTATGVKRLVREAVLKAVYRI